MEEGEESRCENCIVRQFNSFRAMSKAELKKVSDSKVTKKVKEKVPVQFRIKRPSRRELEDGELEYSVEMSNCIKRGILTKAMLYKKYSDDIGSVYDC